MCSDEVWSKKDYSLQVMVVLFLEMVGPLFCFKILFFFRFRKHTQSETSTLRLFFFSVFLAIAIVATVAGFPSLVPKADLGPGTVDGCCCRKKCLTGARDSLFLFALARGD